MYRVLSGPTVAQLELHGWVLDAWFADEPSFRARVDLLQRLDVISAEFDRAKEGRESDGSPAD